jgi:hypothetical protein
MLVGETRRCRNGRGTWLKIEWVNTDKFLDAFEAALKAHSIKHSFRPDWKEATRKMIDEDEARWARAYTNPWFEAVVDEW